MMTSLSENSPLFDQVKLPQFDGRLLLENDDESNLLPDNTASLASREQVVTFV